MACEYRVKRRVEFADTDMAGIVHFSKFFQYMESCEHEFFRSIGLSVHVDDGKQSAGWPRVHAECDYFSPLKFEEEFEIHMQIKEIRSKSISCEYHFTKLNDEDEQKDVAKGLLTLVYVTYNKADGQFKAAQIPDDILDKIDVA